MKATLTFTLPEESSEHEDALNGTKWRSVVWDMDCWLRGRLKHEGAGKDTEDARNELRKIVDGWGLRMLE